MKTLFNFALFTPFVVSVVSASQEKNEYAEEKSTSYFHSNVHVNNTPLPRFSVGPFSIYALRAELKDSSSDSANRIKENSDGEMPPQYFEFERQDDDETSDGVIVLSSEEELPPQYFKYNSEGEIGLLSSEEEMPPQYFKYNSEGEIGLLSSEEELPPRYFKFNSEGEIGLLSSEEELPPRYFKFNSEDDDETSDGVIVLSSEGENPPQYQECDSEHEISLISTEDDDKNEFQPFEQVLPLSPQNLQVSQQGEDEISNGVTPAFRDRFDTSSDEASRAFFEGRFISEYDHYYNFHGKLNGERRR